ncbi:LCP family protein [Paenibacillus larvae]
MKKKTRRLIWMIPLIIILLIAGFAVWRIYTQWGKVYEARPPQTDQNAPTPAVQNLENVYSFLFLGIDSEDVKVGRSDSIILAHLNTRLNKVWLLSIPRDTYVHIYGRKGYDKINHAYAYGGVNSSIRTVEYFLDVPVNYYVAFNFNGVKKFVDELGGIEIDVEKDIVFQDRITHKPFRLKKGRQKLNGEQVLNYARYRGDAEGDFARMRRQQQVVKELLNQTTNYRNVLKLNRLLSVMGDNVKTDIPFTLLTTLAAKVPSLTGNDVSTLTLKAAPVSIGGVSYMKVTNQEQKRISELLQRIAGEDVAVNNEESTKSYIHESTDGVDD